MEAVDLSRRLADFNLVGTEVLKEVNDITEQQIKHWIVNPFLESLGWDPHDKKQVYLDYPAKEGGDHIDYALLDGAGQPRMIIEVRARDQSVSQVGKGAAHAKAVSSPLALITNGHDFSLWYTLDEPPTPLFLLSLKDLAENSESLLGLTAEYRLSDTGIAQLRRSAIRLAVIQMLEDNSEKTFDAMVEWVKAQVAPGALDDITEQAIRDATMIWLTEEHLSLPMFAPSQGTRLNDLRATTARDWEPFPRGPNGTFQYRFDTTKTLDLRQSPKEVREQLRVQGLRTPTATSFGGFYYALRHRAGVGSAA
jgi:hypothetical protein